LATAFEEEGHIGAEFCRDLMQGRRIYLTGVSAIEQSQSAGRVAGTTT
jgi:hypothetical protein